MSALEQDTFERGPRARQMLGDARLVRGIDVGVEQADRDRRRHRARRASRTSAFERRLGQRRLDAAVGADALLDADAAVARDQRRRHLRVERIDLAPIVAADLQHILEARRRHQRALGELALQHGVGGDGGAVQQVADVGQGEAVARGRLLDAGHQPERGVLRRGRRLEAGDGAGARIEDLQIGEGPADVDGDANRQRVLGRHDSSFRACCVLNRRQRHPLSPVFMGRGLEDGGSRLRTRESRLLTPTLSRGGQGVAIYFALSAQVGVGYSTSHDASSKG